MPTLRGAMQYKSPESRAAQTGRSCTRYIISCSAMVAAQEQHVLQKARTIICGDVARIERCGGLGVLGTCSGVPRPTFVSGPLRGASRGAAARCAFARQYCMPRHWHGDRSDHRTNEARRRQGRQALTILLSNHADVAIGTMFNLVVIFNSSFLRYQNKTDTGIGR